MVENIIEELFPMFSLDIPDFRLMPKQESQLHPQFPKQAVGCFRHAVCRNICSQPAPQLSFLL